MQDAALGLAWVEVVERLANGRDELISQSYPMFLTTRCDICEEMSSVFSDASPAQSRDMAGVLKVGVSQLSAYTRLTCCVTAFLTTCLTAMALHHRPWKTCFIPWTGRQRWNLKMRLPWRCSVPGMDSTRHWRKSWMRSIIALLLARFPSWSGLARH